MILIFGGAYQGKLDYAMKEFKVAEKEVYHCDMESMKIDLDKKIINGLERFIFACTREDINALECIEDNIEKLADKIIICDDISQGVVPMEKIERQWREMTGRCMTYLGQQSEQVIRVFCGIGDKVK